MTEIKKKTYVSPSMEVYGIEPTQVLAGSNETNTATVNEWEDGGSLGTCDLD